MSFSPRKHNISLKGFEIQAAEAGEDWTAHLAVTLVVDFSYQLNVCSLMYNLCPFSRKTSLESSENIHTACYLGIFHAVPDDKKHTERSTQR